MIGILEPSHFSVSALAELKKLDKVKLFEGEDLPRFLKNVSILFVRLNHKLDQLTLESAKDLKIICSPTTGLNHIDIEYCRSRHIKILSLKGETGFLKTIRATPEHTLGLILSLYRNYNSAFLSLQNNEWNRDKYRGYEIFNSYIGIIGLGRVGKIIASYLLNMGAHVSYYDIKTIKNISRRLEKYNSMAELIKANDTIVLCSSYDPKVGSIIKRDEINLMRGKYFINTARAELTDEEYLVKMAAGDHFKGIAIDVIMDEQTTRRNLNAWLTLVGSNNIIVTPHIGGATYTSMARTEEFLVNKLKSEIGG
jgi:D-3-phosphoglycerate dehydrogenase